MLAEERWQSILQLLEARNVLSVPELSRVLSASEVTVRRDLSELEQRGKLRRTHGGAIRLDAVGAAREVRLSQYASENVALKEQIGRRAAALIDDHSAIILDASTTAVHLCRLIPTLPLTRLTVITNSLRAAETLAGCAFVELLMVGGQIRKDFLSSYGHLADLTLSRLRADRAFIGMNGVDLLGDAMTTPSLAESAVKQAMMRCAGETVVLADHTKFGRQFLSRVCGVTDVGMIVTDGGVDPALLSQAAERGVAVLTPETELNNH